MRATAVLAALLLVAAPPTAWAATVHTVTAQRHQGTLAGITPNGRLQLKQGGKLLAIPLDKVFRIALQDHPPAPDPRADVQVRTVNRTRLCGRLVPSGRTIGVLSRAVGQSVHLDAAKVLGVRFGRKKEESLSEGEFERELTRPNRDNDQLFVISPKGVVPFNVAVEKITPSKTIFSWEGEDRTIDTARVAAIVFANPVEPDRAPASVQLVETSLLRGELTAFTKGRFIVELCGAKVSVPTSKVVSIEFANPNVVYLSDTDPVKVEEIPFFNHIHPYQRNRNSRKEDGQFLPLRLDGRRYARGLGCDTKTILTYDTAGRFKKFAAVIGIDDAARPNGSVDFIVQGDGKVLLSKRLTGRNAAVTVSLDISGVKKLSLISDFADEINVGDHADWADARVMK